MTLKGKTSRENSDCLPLIDPSSGGNRLKLAGRAMIKRAVAADKDALEVEIAIGTEAKDHPVKGCWDDEENDDEAAQGVFTWYNVLLLGALLGLVALNLSYTNYKRAADSQQIGDAIIRDAANLQRGLAVASANRGVGQLEIPSPHALANLKDVRQQTIASAPTTRHVRHQAGQINSRCEGALCGSGENVYCDAGRCVEVCHSTQHRAGHKVAKKNGWCQYKADEYKHLFEDVQ